MFVVAAASSVRAGDHAPPRAQRHAHPTADAPLPNFRLYTPYDQVRASLVRSGYRPIHILKWPDYSGVYCRSAPQTCRLYPERFICSMTDCTFLFTRPSDGALIEAGAYGDAPGISHSHFTRLHPAPIRCATFAPITLSPGWGPRIVAKIPQVLGLGLRLSITAWICADVVPIGWLW